MVIVSPESAVRNSIDGSNSDSVISVRDLSKQYGNWDYND